MTPKTIAIVGTGPTGIYTLKHLVATSSPLSGTLYKKGARAGIGMPYSPSPLIIYVDQIRSAARVF